MNKNTIGILVITTAVAGVLLLSPAMPNEPALAQHGAQHTTAPTAAPEPAATAEPAPVTFAPEGDSITAWNGTSVTPTWVTYLTASTEADSTLTRVDGFAHGGWKIGQIAANTPACGCDVVVVMAGTNDMSTPRWATPIAARDAALVNIVQRSGARHALIVASPPRNCDGVFPGDPGWVAAWSAEEARVAASYGWTFLDPWAGVRAADGQYLPGTTVEGAHPTATAQAMVAPLIGVAIHQVAGR